MKDIIIYYTMETILQLLGIDILNIIYGYCTNLELCNLAITSKYWYNILSSILSSRKNIKQEEYKSMLKLALDLEGSSKLRLTFDKVNNQEALAELLQCRTHSYQIFTMCRLVDSYIYLICKVRKSKHYEIEVGSEFRIDDSRSKKKKQQRILYRDIAEFVKSLHRLGVKLVAV